MEDKKYSKETSEDTKDTRSKSGSRNRGKKKYSGNKSKSSSNMDKSAGSNSGSNINVAASTIQAMTSANISFGNWAGYEFTSYNDARNVGTWSKAVTLPGICALGIEPHVGVSDSAYSAVNTAAANLYANYTAQTGRTPTYNQADAVLVMLAVSQVNAFYKFALRTYRAMNTVNATNYFFPEVMCKASGINKSSFVKHLADFAFWLEDFRIRLNRCYIPGNIPIMNEMANMLSDVFVDSPDTGKAGMYCYVPEYFLEYDNTSLPTGAYLKPKKWNPAYAGGTDYTLDTFIEFGESLINAMRWDQDMMHIMADIRLVYGADSVLAPEPVELRAPLEPIVNLGLLTTVHASVPVGGALQNIKLEFPDQTTKTISTGSIYQDEYGTVKHCPKYLIGSKYAAIPLIGASVFDMPLDVCDPVSNIIALRNLMLVPNQSLSTNVSGYSFDTTIDNATVVPRECGVVVVNHMWMWTYETQTPYCQPLTSGFTWNTTSYACGIQLMDKFNMHPFMYGFIPLSDSALTKASTPSDFTSTGFLGDVNNYTVITEDIMYKIHHTYNVSQFDIPVMSRR